MLLLKHLPGGRAPVECAVRTSEGIRAADVAWISKAREAPHKRATALPIAPEICVEILSPSNSRKEMLDKMTLYFAKGAEEVWLCDEQGRVEFFHGCQCSRIGDGFCALSGFPAANRRGLVDAVMFLPGW